MKNYYETLDGVKVYVWEGNSHSHRPDLNEEVIGKVAINDRPVIGEVVDMGRVIGLDHLVESHPDDDLFLFDRGRGYESPMVLNRPPEPTQKVTVVICKGSEEDGEYNGKYILITLFEGEPGMPEPFGEYLGDEACEAFWETHVLVPTDEELKKIFETYRDDPECVEYFEANGLFPIREEAGENTTEA